MVFEYFFARRITWNNPQAVSSLVVKFAILSIALSVAVMEVSLSLVQGFETEIQRKVIGFVSHIQIGKYGFLDNMNAEIKPIEHTPEFSAKIKKMADVKNVIPYISKWALVESGNSLEILALKGINEEYDWTFFKKSLKSGTLPNLKMPDESLEVLISQKQSKLLNAKVGDKLTILFIEDKSTMKRRPVKVVGIYNTGLEEFDATTLFCDMRMLQNVMKWSANEVMGYEVNLKSDEHIAEATKKINAEAGYDFEAMSVLQMRPEIFDWLHLQHQNVWVILILMMVVAIINMSSVVLILIIERTKTIGILSALGLTKSRTILIFLWNIFFLILVGIVLGNILGLGLLGFQYFTQIFKLDPENYFLDYVPVAWVWAKFFWVNVATVILCTLCMVLPASAIMWITPIKAIRFQ